MRSEIFTWLMRRPRRWAHLSDVPLTQLSTYLLAVFCLFSVFGFYEDLISGSQRPYAQVLAQSVFSGLNAAIWIVVIAKLRIFWILLLVVLQFFSKQAHDYVGRLVLELFHSPPVDAASGIRFASTGILIAIILSYVFFVLYIRSAGQESFRLRTELALAHSIQKTLVPVIERTCPPFEIFGVSRPSEKVGGDLVDLVTLGGGDVVAYLADIAGHGLQAGILMGMLKTAARTALLDQGGDTGGNPLSHLMKQLNRVLPQVKEDHMYATFTGLRLNSDGRAFYGTAASPPILHWHFQAKKVTRIQEEQFPLGLLAPPEFPATELQVESQDVLVIATDGILEVASHGEDFGVERVESLLMQGAGLPLHQLASEILEAVREFGKQIDDQTILIVRKNATLPVQA